MLAQQIDETNVDYCNLFVRYLEPDVTSQDLRAMFEAR